MGITELAATSTEGEACREILRTCLRMRRGEVTRWSQNSCSEVGYSRDTCRGVFPQNDQQDVLGGASQDPILHSDKQLAKFPLVTDSSKSTKALRKEFSKMNAPILEYMRRYKFQKDETQRCLNEGDNRDL